MQIYKTRYTDYGKDKPVKTEKDFPFFAAYVMPGKECGEREDAEFDEAPPVTIMCWIPVRYWTD